MFVLLSDHVLEDSDTFHATDRIAAQVERDGFLVTFGVYPKRRETGYGYIRGGATIVGHDRCRIVESFVKKPSAEAAQELLTFGDALWNSRMFVFRADRYLDEFQRFRPEILDACRVAVDGGEHDLNIFRFTGEALEACQSVSINFTVMEQTSKAAAVPVGVGWSDIGDWSAMSC